MSEGYVYAGYGVTLATLGIYALRVLARGRALRRTLDAGAGAGTGAHPGPPPSAPPAPGSGEGA
ncbi:MAG: hypothetical protein ACLGIO_12320 [Acidimicrobiia bacterium]